MQLNDEFLNQVRGPINSVWTYIASDMEECSNEVAIECSLDADRLITMVDRPDVQQLIREAFTEHGRSKVFKFLNKNIRLA